MAETAQLREFLARAKRAGASDEALRAILKEKGWAEDEVLGALCAHYEEAAGIAAPMRGRAGAGEKSREGFLYLVSFTTLCVWTLSLGQILFGLIEYWLPDAVMARNMAASYARNQLTWPIASVMAALPAYLWVTRMLVREVEGEPARQSSAVRRWLTYLALFIAATVLVGDAIALLAGVLEGQTPLSFLLKVTAVAGIALPVFLWHFQWLRRTPSGVAALPASDRTWGVAVAAVCVAAIVGAILMRGSPSLMREYAADRQRVRALHGIARSLYDKYRVSAKALPAAGPLDEYPGDPETGELYEYRLVAGTRYELCAVFAQPTQRGANAERNLWDHPEGRHCYVLDVTAEPPAPRW